MAFGNFIKIKGKSYKERSGKNNLWETVFIYFDWFVLKTSFEQTQNIHPCSGKENADIFFCFYLFYLVSSILIALIFCGIKVGKGGNVLFTISVGPCSTFWVF